MPTPKIPKPPAKPGAGADQLVKLQECKWRDTSFPVSELSTTIGQRLVNHMYPDRDGAHVESLGREPIRVSAKCLFYNNISKGKTEQWDFGILFPTVYSQFLEDCKNKAVGTFQHPFLGQFDAKCVSMKTELNAERRDGVTCDVEWIETIKIETFDSNTINAATTIISDAQALDDALSIPSVLSAIPPTLPKDLTFSQMIGAITALIDNITLFGNQVLGMISKALGKLNRLINAITRLDNFVFAGIKTKCQRLKTSLLNLKENTMSILKRKAYYFTEADTTAGALSVLLGLPIAELINANPKIANKAVIKKGTRIKYYKAKPSVR